MGTGQSSENRAEKQRKKDRIRPQRKGVMERRTGAIEREKRDVAKGKLRIKTTVLWADETQRALPPLRLTASSTSRIKVKHKHRRPRESRLKRTRQARPTPTMPLLAATFHARSSVF